MSPPFCCRARWCAKRRLPCARRLARSVSERVSTRTTTTQIPLLGDIPVLGNLFRDRVKVNNRTELLIFITPRVISDKVTQAARL